MSQVLETIIVRVSQDEDLSYFDFETEFDYLFKNGPKEILDQLMRCIYDCKGALSDCIKDMQRAVVDIKTWENGTRARKRSRVEM